MTTETGFHVGEWRIEPSTCQISLDDAAVKLEPRVMDLLVFMADHPGEVLSRDEFLDQVWPGMVVGDEALTNAIIKLRKAFADDARNPRIIETIPKKGYRLVAAVRHDEPTQAVTPPQTGREPAKHSASTAERRLPLVLSAAALLLAVAWILFDLLGDSDETHAAGRLPLPDKPSIAVLPFVNTGNEAAHNYFSDGMTDEVINALSRLSGLFVISRNSTFQFKGRAVDVREVATMLGVHYVLEGSVSRSGDRVRVLTQLVDGQNGLQTWSEKYDRKLEAVFDVQAQIAEQIVAELKVKLNERDRARIAAVTNVHPDAYDELLKGLKESRRFNRDSFAAAERHFQRALEIEPGYARAHVELASIYWQAWQQKWHVNSGSRTGGWVRAKQELDAAAEQPSSAALSLKSAMHLYNRRYEKAIAEARKATEFDPNSASGYLALANALAFDGQPVAAIDEARRGGRRDPGNTAPYLAVEGRANFDLKNDAKAIELLVDARNANPNDRESRVVLLAAYGQTGQKAMARATLDKLNALFRRDRMPEFTQDWPKNRWPYRNAADRERLIQGLRLAGVPDW